MGADRGAGRRGGVVVGVAGCGGRRAGFTRGTALAAGAGAAGPGLGVLGFYGLETFGLNQTDGLQAQVNLANGNLVVHAADLKINAPGPVARDEVVGRHSMQ